MTNRRKPIKQDDDVMYAAGSGSLRKLLGPTVIDAALKIPQHVLIFVHVLQMGVVRPPTPCFF